MPFCRQVHPVQGQTEWIFLSVFLFVGTPYASAYLVWRAAAGRVQQTPEFRQKRLEIDGGFAFVLPIGTH